MTTLLVLASSALAALTATIITLTIVYREERGLHDGVFDLECDLQLSKERINEDLVEHNQRLNKHLLRDFHRPTTD